MNESAMNSSYYDVIVIGSGMSGLYSALQIQRFSPSTKIGILEKYKKHWIGGRTSNNEFYGTKIVTGAGIGREDTNPLLIHLMKEFRIPYEKTTSVMNYSSQIANPVSPIAVIDILRKSYKKNPALYRHETFKKFAEKTLGVHLYHSFVVSSGYTDYEEADIYETLYNYGMDDTEGGWPMLMIPWKRLVQAMAHKIGMHHFHFSRNVVNIHPKRSIQSIQSSEYFEVECSNGDAFYAKKIIVATTISSIQHLFSSIINKRQMSLYTQIHSQPFLRVYGKFNKKSTAIMKEKVKHYTIVPGPLQKIIPMNPDKGVYMIAYSDNKSAMFLKKYTSNTEEHRSFFAQLVEKSIGVPQGSLHLIAMKEYYWNEGTHYYEPLQDYRTREDFIYHAQHPMKDVVVVGEAVSRYQGWVEGALESVKSAVTQKWLDAP